MILGNLSNVFDGEKTILEAVDNVMSSSNGTYKTNNVGSVQSKWWRRSTSIYYRICCDENVNDNDIEDVCDKCFFNI